MEQRRATAAGEAAGKLDLGFVQRAWKWVGIVTRIKGGRK